MGRNESGPERRLRLVHEHGYNGLSLLTLYDGWRYFEPSDIEGFIAFEVHRGVAVACGDPVCGAHDIATLLRRFAEYCESRGWRFTFVGASARVTDVAVALGLKAVKVGEEPFFDLARHTFSGRAAKKARSAINLARRTGVVVEEYTQASPAIDNEILETADDWLRTREAPPMGFILRSRPLALRDRKHIFTATYEGRIVGVVTCVPAPGRRLLYVEELLRRHDAPYGTGELLIDAARGAAQAGGYALLSLGVAPLQGTTSQPHGKHRLLTALFRAVTSRLNFIYSFRSLNHYKKKFGPTFWEDNFVIYQSAMVLTAFAVISAFAPDGLPSLLLPKRMQWLRLVPGAVLGTAALAGVFMTAFAFYWFPDLRVPVELVLDAILFTGHRGDHMVDAAARHRVITALAVFAVGAGAWFRRARA
ncbi:MAG TPA: DUF2156 domain-containing protein [Dehalococcoidia bacterium]|jgi:lysylphosphatidylglycerol synthetase-like protein (DUF2156 family)|nr:DUF2156 domain-containing protein [Dehalococcoidia bacterium]